MNPSGKLPMTLPRNDAQLPAWDDLDFSGDLVDGFGYGLSYTTFEYGNLEPIRKKVA